MYKFLVELIFIISAILIITQLIIPALSSEHIRYFWLFKKKQPNIISETPIETEMAIIKQEFSNLTVKHEAVKEQTQIELEKATALKEEADSLLKQTKQKQ